VFNNLYYNNQVAFGIDADIVVFVHLDQ